MGEKLVDVGLELDDMGLILEENERQLKLWGKQENHPFVWASILGEEVGELHNAMLQYFCFKPENTSGKEEIAKEAIQVATLALKIAVMAKGQLN